MTNWFPLLLCSQYLGALPYIFVHDLDILKEVLVKNFDNFTNRMVSIDDKGNKTAFEILTCEE